MFLFADCGRLEPIRNLMKSYHITGITTNPKIAGNEVDQVVEEFKLPTSIQIDVTDQEEALHSATKKHMSNQLYNIKVPISHLQLGKLLIERKIPVNFTLCFNLAQVIGAVNVGATYVSIFVGRLLDNFKDPYEIIRAARKYIESCSSETQIIAASIRNIEHLEIAAKSGAHIVTASPEVWLSAMEHEQTRSGLKEFAQYFH